MTTEKVKCQNYESKSWKCEIKSQNYDTNLKL